MAKWVVPDLDSEGKKTEWSEEDEELYDTLSDLAVTVENPPLPLSQPVASTPSTSVALPFIPPSPLTRPTSTSPAWDRKQCRWNPLVLTSGTLQVLQLPVQEAALRSPHQGK